MDVAKGKDVYGMQQNTAMIPKYDAHLPKIFTATPRSPPALWNTLKSLEMS
jgi:hypothetical protein